MKKTGLIIGFVLMISMSYGQGLPNNNTVVKISRADLAGEGLLPKVIPGETDTSYYEQRVYDGEEFIVYLVAIKNRTNEFERFPVEEFIFWADGKAIVEPAEGSAFAVQAGDYFIQPKGFKGKFNFVSGDEPHLELALISRRRSDSALVSPMRKAMILDPNIISGSSEAHVGEFSQIYKGIELEVNLVRHNKRAFKQNPKERLVHVLSGVLSVGDEVFYPGDFFVIPKDFSGTWQAIGFRPFRALEVLQVDF